MLMNKSNDNTILFNTDFEVNSLTFTEVKEAKLPKGSKEAYPIYNNLSRVSFQLSWFNLSCYGIPQLGDFITENKQRLFIKIPLDLSIPSVKEVYDKFITIDSYLSSSDFKSKIIESSKINKYIYQPIVRIPEEDSKNKLPYIKINFDTDYTDLSIKTILFKSILEDDKRVRTKINDINTIDDITEYITYQSNIRPIIRPVRLWIQPYNTKDPKYGLKFNMIKVEVEPSQNNRKKINYNSDNFIDDDQDTNEIILCKNFNINNLSFSDIKEAKLPKGSKEAYPIYKINNKNVDFIQLPWFQVISYGIPQLGDYITENKQRLFIKIPLDLSNPDIKEVYDKFVTIDSYLSSTDFRSNVFENSKVNKYVYQPIIRIPENEDNDKKIKYPYIKINFDTNIEDNSIKTGIFNSNNNNRTFIEDIKDIDDVTKYITYLSKIRPIIKPVRLWIQPSNIKDPKYGLKLKIIKVEVEKFNKNNLNYQDDTFIDIESKSNNDTKLKIESESKSNNDTKLKIESESSSESEPEIKSKNNNLKSSPQVIKSDSDSSESDTEIKIKQAPQKANTSSSSTSVPKKKQNIRVLDSESDSESDSNKEIKPVKKAVSKSVAKKK